MTPRSYLSVTSPEQRRSLPFVKQTIRQPPEQADVRRRPKRRGLNPPSPVRPSFSLQEGGTLAGEKATREHSNHRKKKKKTLIISKQINKAMTKQYIYIYRYKKKERKMCNDSSIIFTQKCSHLYNNLR